MGHLVLCCICGRLVWAGGLVGSSEWDGERGQKMGEGEGRDVRGRKGSMFRGL